MESAESFESCQNENSKLLRSLLDDGLPRRLFQAVQRDRARTSVSTAALRVCLGLARGAFGERAAARSALCGCANLL